MRGAADTWVSPSVLFRRLQACMPDATFTTDSGNGTTYGAEALRVVEGTRYMGPVNYSSMGFSVPAAIGAAIGAVSRSLPRTDSSRGMVSARPQSGAIVGSCQPVKPKSTRRDEADWTLAVPDLAA